MNKIIETEGIKGFLEQFGGRNIKQLFDENPTSTTKNGRIRLELSKVWNSVAIKEMTESWYVGKTLIQRTIDYYNSWQQFNIAFGVTSNGYTNGTQVSANGLYTLEGELQKVTVKFSNYRNQKTTEKGEVGLNINDMGYFFPKIAIPTELKINNPFQTKSEFEFPDDISIPTKILNIKEDDLYCLCLKNEKQGNKK